MEDKKEIERLIKRQMRDRRMDVEISAEKQDREEESRAKTEGKVSREKKIRDKWGGGRAAG